VLDATIVRWLTEPAFKKKLRVLQEKTREEVIREVKNMVGLAVRVYYRTLSEGLKQKPSSRVALIVAGKVFRIMGIDLESQKPPTLEYEADPDESFL
jgi:hypothetical protein